MQNRVWTVRQKVIGIIAPLPASCSTTGTYFLGGGDRPVHSLRRSGYRATGQIYAHDGFVKSLLTGDAIELQWNHMEL
ncbi:uncharacterized protein N7498_009760 [Penicillium cinerascens]|uniref:Uncharacterized protein n=1 Tax=Penicillium cinerascens TaxID=70096 RepID=A0A9W9J5M6_9EURO|nr:uncharacterized protein N7498_009760 [Penicillium cinerascens]KAJ5190775.1 hypothetical protein N7498_009760 [Penicillium cinerascens]